MRRPFLYLLLFLFAPVFSQYTFAQQTSQALEFTVAGWVTGSEFAPAEDDEASSKIPLVNQGSFGAGEATGAIALQWKTHREQRHARFEVERSVRTHDDPEGPWQRLAFVAGNGTTDSLITYSYFDYEDISNATAIYYRLRQVSFDGSVSYSEVIEAPLPVPQAFAVSSYPDPYKPVAYIKYDLPKSARVRISVYNEAGKTVKKLVNKQENAGRYKVEFNASDLGAGLYTCRLEAGGNIWVEPILLVK